MEISKIKAVTSICIVDQCHIWRSKFFDKTSKSEGELKRLLAEPADAKLHFRALAEKLLLKNNTEKLKADKNGILIKLLQELIPLIELRAELAHSTLLSVSATDGLAMFQNANARHIHFDKITVLNEAQRNHSYSRISWITGQLASIK